MKYALCVLALLTAPAYAAAQGFPAQRQGTEPRQYGYASPPAGPARFVEPAPARWHSVDMLLSFTNFDYKESLPPGLKSTEKGWIPGVLLKYGYHRNRLEASFALETGEAGISYDGTTQTGTPVKGTTNSSLTNGEALLNFAFISRRDGFAGLTGYAGVGYREWERTLGAGTSGSYLETYSWDYYPLGLRAELRLSDKLSAGLDACVKFMSGGKIVIGFANMGADSDLTLNLGARTGYRAAAHAAYAYGPKWSFIVAPWYERSAIGRSSTGTIMAGGSPYATAYEPASRTVMYGVNLGLVYKFSVAR